MSSLISALKGRNLTFRPKNIAALKGIIKTQPAHRGPGGRWIKAREILNRPLPKSRMSTRHDYGWTHPRDRVKRPNVFAGDKVRLYIGKEKDKFEEIEVNGEKRRVWKVYTVYKVQADHNRVFLAGLEATRRQVPRPENWDEMTPDDQARWNAFNRPRTRPKLKPVQYSNIGLCVHQSEDKLNHVFVTRLKSSGMKWDHHRKHYRWDRYALGLTAELPSAVAKNCRASPKGWKIPWPSREIRTKESYPTLNESKQIRPEKLSEITYKPITDIPAAVATAAYDPLHLFPTTIQSPAPTDLYSSDMYLNDVNVHSLSDSAFDGFMPLHLADELAPRFAKHKMADLYKLRIEATARAREKAGKDAVAEWEASGRDRNLRRVLDLDEVGLEGVPVKPRTPKEVYEQALFEFDEATKKRKKELHLKLDKQGMKWDYELGGWIKGPKALKLERKKEQKQKRLKKVEEGLRNLRLEPAKNMVVPAWMRKESGESSQGARL